MKLALIAVIFTITFSLSYGQEERNILQLNGKSIVKIDSMITTGNSKVRSKVILGESRLKSGQEIQIHDLRKELINSRQNLFNTRLFNDVEILIYKWSDDNKVSIEFAVDERWYIYPFPILELSGISFQEWEEEFDYDFQRVTYGLTVDHNNLTGNGDKLDFEWNAGFQHRYKFDYELVGIDKNRNWGISTGFDYLKTRGSVVSAEDNFFNSELFRDFVIKSQAVNFSIFRRKFVNRRHGILFSYNEISIADELKALSPDYLPKGASTLDYASFGYFGFIENRNLSEYPTSGEFISGNILYSGAFDENLNQLRLLGNANLYRPLNEKLFASVGAHARYTPIYEESFFTLRNARMRRRQSPRGYNLYQLFPTDFATVKSELRYQLVDTKFEKVPILPKRFEPTPFKLYPKVFFDTGRTFPAKDDFNNSLNDEFLYSYGMGFDFVSLYNIPFLFELTRNHLGETTFNFTIGNSF